MARDIDERKPKPNFWMCYAVFCAFLAWNVWPKPDAYFGYHLLAFVLSLSAIGGVIRFLGNIRRDYRRRQAVADAQYSSGVFGKARYATAAEQMAAGLLDPNGTLLLGTSRTLPLFLPNGKSMMVQSPPGGGKTTSLVTGAIRHLLATGRSVVVSDAKPELVYQWAEPLRQLGFRVIINNPALLPDWPHHNSNPLDSLKQTVSDPASQGAVYSMAEELALSLVPEIKTDKNEFFRRQERNALAFTMIVLAGFEPENCYPAQAQQALTDPKRFEQLCLLASQNGNALNGDLAAQARNFLGKHNDNPEHFEGAISGAANALSAFKSSSTLGTVGASHEFDPKELRDTSGPPTVIFDVMPADKLSVFSKANALMQTARLQALKRHRVGREAVFVCDEATNLPVPTVVEEIELARSFGISMLMFFQSFSSLVRAYGKERAESIRASCIEMYFAVGDVATATEISKRSGELTVKTNSQSFDEFGKPSRSVSEGKRAFLPVDEILSMPRGDALLFHPGLRPIRLKKMPWFEVEPYKSEVGDNPHERHPKSKITRLTLKYGHDASDIGPPSIPDIKKRIAAAQRLEAARKSKPRVPFFKAGSFQWVPVIALCASLVYFAGTPHVVFQYESRANPNAVNACVYMGLSGIRSLSVKGECPLIKLVLYPALERS
ncbi:MAG: type IV secretory system conjugative DNA transfer family protein [Pseudomonadota bacterium]